MPIWLVVSVGIAVGAGFYFLAVATAVLSVIILLGLKHWPTRPTMDRREEEPHAGVVGRPEED